MQSPLPRVEAAAPLMSARRVMIISAFMVAIGPVSMALFTPAMPEIVHAFGTTESAVKLALSLYFGGFAFAQLIAGPLSDGLGRRPVTVAFMSLYVVASLVALISPTVEVLIVARFLQGVGAAAGVAISRAIVRDLFSGERAVGILNLVGIILSIGPASAPTLGGVMMAFFGWHSVFLVMLAMGVGIVLVAIFALRETVPRDLSRIRFRQLIGSYATLLRSRYFVLASLVFAGSVGALYAQATMLPFILMNTVGMTPAEFGVGMLMQSGFYLFGALVFRQVMKLYPAHRLVPVGLGFVGAGSLLIAILPHTLPITFLSVMGPVGVYSFGIAFITSAMMTAALAPYPAIAGAAAALNGFIQIGFGLLGSLVGAAIGDPDLAMSIVIPAMGLTSILSFVVWRRLPVPAMIRPA